MHSAIDDDQLRLGEAPRHQIVEDGTSGGLALATHVLDREHHLLAITADPEPDPQGDGRGLAVKTCPHDRVVPELHGVRSSPSLPIGTYAASANFHQPRDTPRFLSHSHSILNWKYAARWLGQEPQWSTPQFKQRHASVLSR